MDCETEAVATLGKNCLSCLGNLLSRAVVACLSRFTVDAQPEGDACRLVESQARRVADFEEPRFVDSVQLQGFSRHSSHKINAPVSTGVIIIAARILSITVERIVGYQTAVHLEADTRAAQT